MDTFTDSSCGYIDVRGTYVPNEWVCPHCHCNPCICSSYTYTYGWTYPIYPDLSAIEEKLDKIIKLLDPDNRLDNAEEIRMKAWEDAVKFLMAKVKGRYKELFKELESEFGSMAE